MSNFQNFTDQIKPKINIKFLLYQHTTVHFYFPKKLTNKQTNGNFSNTI